MAMALRLKPQIKLRQNPNTTITHFCSSSLPPPPPPPSNNEKEDPQSQSEPPLPQSPPTTLQSKFTDIKSTLRKTLSSRPSPSNSAALEAIRNNLQQFRVKTSPPSTPQSTEKVSFQELFKKNPQSANAGKSHNFESIRESLTKLRNNPTQTPNQTQLFSNILFRDSLNAKPGFNAPKSSVVRGGSETTPPPSFFGNTTVKEEESVPGNKLVKTYSYVELGQKLRKLRPVDGKVIGQNGLSFKELNDRLVKLREEELKEAQSKNTGTVFRDLRAGLEKIGEDQNRIRSKPIALNILATLGGTNTLLTGTPKEHLVEKYFHPDNMSSAEKLKLELKKIRDEFKLSESDCGSSRVQVAQLTVKIKHLSSVLHKKDKHSRKGVEEMVQRRKKLLRYLRRTDWDSYCFCLSNLGLRDNPDYKNHGSKKKNPDSKKKNPGSKRKN